ncbi:hypothetical protein JF634_10180 [Simonsiella muelleri]|uniref:Uncharacterized protein n=1 Tax=Simonsiella muelleri ATCC 29453 TaxID=641147 RepID=V9HKR0_9NEIS|nr:hypothetical protein [Simonsiella muelleri]AUX61475.1 hypothetical protein BWP33_06405 [Simonsiella muelleri ATCC 29453]EFG30685.1 hypothetical protein HMPREF9021_01291 [Simonsiella muelleri ATCC 29453]UBQ53526.1 hypothetical protein JF634_10180 [Simonsiella muelleri]
MNSKDFKECFVVQDLETFEFLCSDGLGGIEQMPYLSMAGKYDNYDSAFEAGVDEIGGVFSVFKFYESVNKE